MNGLASGLCDHIEALLELKHAIGLPYATSERHLRRFDAMCARDYPDVGTLTREMAMAWAFARPGEHVNTQSRRITPVRQLAKHMAGCGVAAYVIPVGIPGRGPRYQPHLFTHEQLRALFDAADRIVPSPYGGQRQLVIPAIFRMIYCLGLRPGEARRLTRSDVDLAKGTVHVRQSKGHKDRLVFMSSDLQHYCRRYDSAINAWHPERSAFFPNRTGRCYSAASIDCWFGELLHDIRAGLVVDPSAPPRVYDLRHAHVVETINRWARGGRDPEALVSYLSLHLGHTNVADTWYYFHLAADYHPELRALANAEIEPALPEPSDGVG
jgi:integrase